MRMKRWAIVRFNVTSSPRLRTVKLNTRPPSGSVRLNRTTGTPPNAASPRVKLRRTSPVSIRSFRFESAHSTSLRSSSWYSLDAPSVLAYHTSNVPDLYETPNWSWRPGLASTLVTRNSLPDSLGEETRRWVASPTESGTPSPSESVSVGSSRASDAARTTIAVANTSANADVAANARTSLREAATDRPPESMGGGRYKELIIRFSKLPGRPYRARAAPPLSSPRPDATSFADDFSERHPAMDLRDANLDLIPDLRPRDEDHEVLDSRQSIAFPTDVLDLRLIDLPLLHRKVRRSEARARIRHLILHAARLPRRAFATRCTVFNDIGVCVAAHPRKRSRAAQRAHVLLDIGRAGEPQREDEEHDADDQDDQADRGHEPVPRTERVEGVELTEADPQDVVKPGPERDPGTAEEDQENPRVEQELLAEPGFRVAGLFVGLFRRRFGGVGGPLPDGLRRAGLHLEELPALGALDRVHRDDGLAGRAFGDERLGLRHGLVRLRHSEAIVVWTRLSELIGNDSCQWRD